LGRITEGNYGVRTSRAGGTGVPQKEGGSFGQLFGEEKKKVQLQGNNQEGGKEIYVKAGRELNRKEQLKKGNS